MSVSIRALHGLFFLDLTCTLHVFTFFFTTWPDLDVNLLDWFVKGLDLKWIYIYYFLHELNMKWKKNLNHPRDCTWSVFFKEIKPFFSRDPAVFCKKKVNMFQNNASAQKGWLATYYNNISIKCWRRNSTRQIWIKSVPRAMYPACFKF